MQIHNCYFMIARAGRVRVRFRPAVDDSSDQYGIVTLRPLPVTTALMPVSGELRGPASMPPE
jgi:hypothetical protein